MRDCGDLFLVGGLMAIGAAVAAWIVGRFVGRMAEPNTWVILGAIVVSLAVLQVGARLAVIVKGRVEAAGFDPTAVCDGNLGLMSWVATLMIIVAYVGAFFASWRRAKRGA
ncbi:MAG TPA: hypothetical protein DEO85_14005 [Maritimibacter sp.]|nr:hypothetical protein [Maritimibacter sp.]